MDNYSRDLQELMSKHKVNVIRTPKSVMAEQLKAWDVLTKRLSDEDPFFAKVVESQRAWAKRVAYYMFVNEADYDARLRARVQDQAAGLSDRCRRDRTGAAPRVPPRFRSRRG